MIFVQANGKICILERNDLVCNLTEEEYVEYEKKKAEEYAREKLKNPNTIGDVLKYKQITNKQLKAMGYDKTYEEMMKYIPKRVERCGYSGRDCTTYGKCPTCGTSVQDGIGFTEEQCPKCGQMLDWRW